MIFAEFGDTGKSSFVESWEIGENKQQENKVHSSVSTV